MHKFSYEELQHLTHALQDVTSVSVGICVGGRSPTGGFIRGEEALCLLETSGCGPAKLASTALSRGAEPLLWPSVD
ncbi:unnamed protein product [Gadus morhua 'NCC']